jgi:hypothetical protein
MGRGLFGIHGRRPWHRSPRNPRVQKKLDRGVIVALAFARSSSPGAAHACPNPSVYEFWKALIRASVVNAGITCFNAKFVPARPVRNVVLLQHGMARSFIENDAANELRPTFPGSLHTYENFTTPSKWTGKYGWFLLSLCSLDCVWNHFPRQF